MRSIPPTMIGANRWLRWRLIERNGRMSKLPIMADGRTASSTNPDTWARLLDVMDSDEGHGVGFALGDGFGCIDLDYAVDAEGFIEPWAERILERTPLTFIEVSQSMRGLHIWGRLPEGKGRNLRSKGMSVEIYSTGRFIALGGQVWEHSAPFLADLTPLANELVS